MPAKVRDYLGIRSGGDLAFEIVGDQVVIRKGGQADSSRRQSAFQAFSDWNTPEADEAFRDL